MVLVNSSMYLSLLGGCGRYGFGQSACLVGERSRARILFKKKAVNLTA